MYYAYRSIADLNNLIIKNLNIFPHDIDLVVGVPRSGMLPANLIALYLNKPFTDIDSFISGRIYSSGERGTFISQDGSKKVLIVDDSISSGNALSKAKSKLKDVEDKYKLLYAVVFASTQSKHSVDIYLEIIDYPRVFQWNLFHHPAIIPKSCFDIDGVLCQDPPVDDNGPEYTSFIANAPSLYIPTVEIDTLVSCRLEKYRDITEEWLRKNNVKYKRLVMLPFKTREERLAWSKHGEYKGEVYKKSKNSLFVESSYSQACTISRISGKPVFCTETFEMITDNPSLAKAKQSLRDHVRNLLRPLYRKIKPLVNKANTIRGGGK